MKKIIIVFAVIVVIGIFAKGFQNSEMNKKIQELATKDNACKQATGAIENITKAFETELNKRGEPWGIQNHSELLEIFYSPKQKTCLGSFHIHLELAKTAKAEFIAKLFNYPTDKKDIYVVRSTSQESPLFTTDDKVKLDEWIKENK